jgi:hypothetical protein
VQLAGLNVAPLGSRSIWAAASFGFNSALSYTVETLERVRAAARDDDEAHVRAVLAFIRPHSNVIDYELLPYHRYGESK